MATDDFTASDNNATDSQLAERFPINSDPFSVWFNPEAARTKWVVNDVDGASFVDTRDYETAAEIAFALKNSQAREGVTSAPADSKSLSSPRLEALDTLNHAVSIAKFIQAITLIPGRGEDIHLSPDQICGLFCVMKDMINRLERVGELLSQSGGPKVQHG